MGIIKISIERTNEQKYEAQLDCTQIDLGDNEEYIAEYIAIILNDALKAVFGGEGDLFDVYDILIECLAIYRPPYTEYLHTESICGFFNILKKAWRRYDCDKHDFRDYFRKYFKNEKW